MSPRPLLQGEQVRLAAFDQETGPEAWSRWMHDSEYSRLLDSAPAFPWTPNRIKAEMEKELVKNDSFLFAIRTITDDILIGFVSLDGIQWSHGTAWVAIGIGERSYRGKGLGTDAMREALRYAFTELNLYRVNLDVFEYNKPAIRSYEKAGFVHEGRLPERLHRDGRYWDLLFMGILRDEWEKIVA